jgi:FlaA1/EpsC-like NDP-sugar epimerase
VIRNPVTLHRAWQLAVDGLLVAAAWWIAWKLRFDELVVPVFYRDYLDAETITIVVAIKIGVFVVFGFYHRWWRYVSTRDMWGAARGVTVAAVATYLFFFLVPMHELRVPRAIVILDWLLLLAFVATSRMLARTLIERPSPGALVARGREVIVVGAGDAGQLVVRELQKNRSLRMTPIGLIDDDPRKRNIRLHGVRVLGTTDELPHLLRDNRPDEVLIAIPSASGATRQKVVDAARQASVPVKTLPGLHELIAGDVNLAGRIRPVQVEDVLGREPVEVDLVSVASYLEGETVLVTGAGGSIGAELCRQIARLGAARLVLVEQSEAALFAIERELVDERGFTAAAPVLADVRDRNRMRLVFESWRPAVVFHAAAYKHVPLMEANPIESMRNNVLGTRTVANVAVEFGVRRFVLISTDKALNPNSVYGRSKTLCEWIVAARAGQDVATRFVAVRFGNVLGSTGSVIPIFRRQIERGGPVTVTDPAMTRFFMTIPEAASLVVQAGAIGGRGQIFVLDMGEPVNILELARNMIRLSGKEPEVDIPISFIGARPGEKIHEELFAEGETWRPTAHPKILALDVEPIDRVWLDDQLDELDHLAEAGEILELVSRMGEVVREPRHARPVAARTESRR